MSPSNLFKNNAEASEGVAEEAFAVAIEAEVDSEIIGVALEGVTEVALKVTKEVTPHKEAIEEEAKEVSVQIGRVVDFLREEATTVVIEDLGITIHLEICTRVTTMMLLLASNVKVLLMLQVKEVNASIEIVQSQEQNAVIVKPEDTHRVIVWARTILEQIIRQMQIPMFQLDYFHINIKKLRTVQTCIEVLIQNSQIGKKELPDSISKIYRDI